MVSEADFWCVGRFLDEKNFVRFFFGKSENFSLSLTYIDKNFKFRLQGKTLGIFLSLMNCPNTILMPEMNSTHNFTIEINFGWPLTRE